MSVNWHKHGENTACTFSEDTPNIFVVTKRAMTSYIGVDMSLHVHSRVEGNCLFHVGKSTYGDKQACVYSSSFSAPYPHPKCICKHRHVRGSDRGGIRKYWLVTKMLFEW